MLVTLTEADELPKLLAEGSNELLPIAVIDENGVWLPAVVTDGIGDGLTSVLGDIVSE